MYEIHGKRVTVAGLGRFGGNIAAARWLVEQEAKVLVTDTAAPEKLAESVAQLAGLPIEFRLGEHREADFADANLVVASPAVAPSNPFLAAARAANVPVTTEIVLFIERCPGTIFAVTGSKGKSTTTALLGRMLAPKFNAFVGGNIGKSLLEDLPKIGKSDLVVLELSSFMLHYLGQLQWSPHVAVVTLIAQDHTEWHGSEEAYVDAKKTIVRHQRADDYAVLNEESRGAMDFAIATAAKVISYGVRNRKPFALTIPGRHNQLNAQGAFAAAQIVGVDWSEAQAAIADFPGLPHRLQLVHEANGVRYFNDSIATIPEAAVAALDSFGPKKVVQIVGGSDKHLPLTAMCAALSERAKAVLCIGVIGAQVAEILANSAGAPVYRCGDLATAMKLARQIASSGDVVLLSPGAASFDQFVNFEERGNAFVRLARGEVGESRK